MDITKTMTFTSAEYHMLKLAARGEGKKPEEFLASLLTRFFRAMADLQGIECPVTVTPEHIHRPTAAVAAEEEEPASICPPPRVPLPVPVPPSLRGPGEPIPDPGNIDWDDPETYR